MAKLQITGGAVVDHSEDGWAEFKKWLDGTHSRLRYTWVEDAVTYTVVAPDTGVFRVFSFNKDNGAVQQEFEA